MMKHPLLTSMVLTLLSSTAAADDLAPKPLPGGSSSSETTTTTTETVAASPEAKPSSKVQETTPVLSSLPAATESSSASCLAKRMDAVIAQNGGASNEHLFKCADDDLFCVSGLLDVDAKYFDRRGNPGTAAAFVPAFASSYVGVGLRPMFGQSIRTFTGSFNNANLFMDLKIPSYLKIHTNLAYVNGSSAVNAYQAEWGADYGSVYRLPAALKVDELYVVISNADLLPIYFKIGRMYSEFGDYTPNGYGIKTIVPSLTQLMTQHRTGAGQLGIILPCGFYSSLSINYAEQSIARIVEPQSRYPHRMNFSGKIGFSGEVAGLDTNINVSAIDDIRDVDYINDGIQLVNFVAVNYTIAPNYIYTSKKKGGVAFHADLYRCPFGLSLEGAKTFGKMNPRTFGPNAAFDSHLYTAGIEGRMEFAVLGHPSDFKVGYQLARHSQIIEPPAGTTPHRLHNIMPHHRWQLTYDVKIWDHLNAGITWVRDHDFDFQHAGLNYGSNEVVGRLDVEF